MQSRKSVQQKKDLSGASKILPFGFFLFLCGIYILTMSGHIHTIDSFQVYSVTKSLAEKGSLEIPPCYMHVEGIDGKYYSKFGIGQSILALPLYKCAQLLYPLVPPNVIHQMDAAQKKVVTRLDNREAIPQYLRSYEHAPPGPFYSFIVLTFNSVITAWGMTLLYIILTKLGYGTKESLMTAGITALATFVWPLSRDFFQHPLILLLLLRAIDLSVEAKNHQKFSVMLQIGLIVALAVLIRIFTLTLIPVFALFIVWRLYVSHADMKKGMLSMACYMGPVIISIIVILILNYVRFGGMFKSGYSLISKSQLSK